jgi:putative transcriptional regulator
MTITGKYRSEALAAIHETAADLHRVVGMDQKKMQQFDTLCLKRMQTRNPRRSGAQTATSHLDRKQST